MGTINYKTSDYITIGYNCFNMDLDDFDYCAEIYDEIQRILNNYRFYYFHVALNAGYYEGFYFDIENNFSWAFDGWQDKREAQKEITQIKQLLLECINNYDCCAVSPGWCTSYYDYNETLKRLDIAIKEMRDDVRKTPTWATLPASEKFA